MGLRWPSIRAVWPKIVFGSWSKTAITPTTAWNAVRYPFSKPRRDLHLAGHGATLTWTSTSSSPGSRRRAPAMVDRVKGSGWGLPPAMIRTTSESMRNLALTAAVAELFDLVVDSSQVGMRKAEPGHLPAGPGPSGRAAPERTIFLDDFRGKRERRPGSLGMQAFTCEAISLRPSPSWTRCWCVKLYFQRPLTARGDDGVGEVLGPFPFWPLLAEIGRSGQAPGLRRSTRANADAQWEWWYFNGHWRPPPAGGSTTSGPSSR